MLERNNKNDMTAKLEMLIEKGRRQKRKESCDFMTKTNQVTHKKNKVL